MPSRKRQQEFKRRGSWELMVREPGQKEPGIGVRERVQVVNPNVVRALDMIAARFGVWQNGHGWTFFTEWLEQVYPKARRVWPCDLPVVQEHVIWEAVFPSCK